MNKKQLWDSILQQAISGKLVPQLDSEPAVEQLCPTPAKDEILFALPEKWQWIQLSSLGCLLTGKTPPTTHQEYFGTDIPFITPGDIDDICSVNYTNRGVSLAAKEIIKTVPINSVFMVCIGGSIGKCGIAAQEIAFNQQINAIIPTPQIVVPAFLLEVFRAPFFQHHLMLKAKGTAVPIINKKEWGTLWVPLPPLEEQSRIVAKLEELKPLVEQFGEAYDKLSELEVDFPRKLKSSILQAAMQGKLVPQLDSEPAVEQIGPALDPDDVPFELPEKWKWVQLKHLNLASFSGGTPTKNNPDYWNGTIPWASIKDLSVDSEELNATQDHITEKGVANSSTKLVEANNIIVGMRMGLDKIAINKISVAINQDLRAFYLDYKLIDPKFFIKFYKTLRFEGSGTTVKGIKKNELMVLLVPLPPLEEQRRIVARIEELFAEVDKMSSYKAP